MIDYMEIDGWEGLVVPTVRTSYTDQIDALTGGKLPWTPATRGIHVM